MMNSRQGERREERGYASIHGLKMYYEIEGAGKPLVYLPPAFGHAGLKSFPSLARNYSVLTLDFQGHGRTADIADRPLSLEQNAEDVVALLRHLGISKAHFFGESYGASLPRCLPFIIRTSSIAWRLLAPPLALHTKP